MSNVKIDSVVGFLSKIMLLGAVNNDCKRFYRGHASSRWELVPGIYRKKEGATTQENYHKNEHEMFRDIVAHHSTEFSQCSSAIEYLVKMQHYGLLTRLLDITTNPLIALYFACADEKYKDKDGEVIVFDVPSTSIKHYDSDTISVLANLSKSKEFRVPLYSIRPYAEGSSGPKVKFHENLDLGITVRNYCDNLFEKSDTDTPPEELTIQSLNKLRGAFYKVDESKYSEEEKRFESYIKGFNKHGHIRLLLHQIKFEKSHFEAKIHPYDLPRVWVSHVKLDNQRIINQSGAFFIFGLGCIQDPETKELCYVKDVAPAIPKDWVKIIGNHKILIDRDKKDNILSELETIGISKSFVFPEIQTYAEELKRKYGIVPQGESSPSSLPEPQQSASSLSQEQGVESE